MAVKSNQHIMTASLKDYTHPTSGNMTMLTIAETTATPY
jgi:hypothetical protein